METTAGGHSWSAGRVFFDHDTDGFAERTGWVSGNDGLLVLDRNGDGIINAGDAAFSQLRVWKDEDEDGLSFPTELYTLPELGIASINLTPTAAGGGTDAQGNTQERIGTFTWADGTTGQIAEYTFDRNTAYTIATEWVDVPDDVAALPDLPGYGTVPRLQQAMARDTSGTLKGHVQNFMAASTRTGRQTAVRGILNAWTGSSNIDAVKYARGGLSGPQVGVLSAFFGQSFFTSASAGAVRAVWAPFATATMPLAYHTASLLNPDLGGTAMYVPVSGTGPLASGSWTNSFKGKQVAPNESYRQISELFYSQLMAQTHLRGMWGLVAYTWDDNKQAYQSDMTPVIATMKSWFNQTTPLAAQTASASSLAQWASAETTITKERPSYRRCSAPGTRRRQAGGRRRD